MATLAPRRTSPEPGWPPATASSPVDPAMLLSQPRSLAYQPGSRQLIARLPLAEDLKRCNQYFPIPTWIRCTCVRTLGSWAH